MCISDVRFNHHFMQKIISFHPTGKNKSNLAFHNFTVIFQGDNIELSFVSKAFSSSYTNTFYPEANKRF